MTMTLGEALIPDDSSASFLEDVSITERYDKATEETDKERSKLTSGVLDGALKKAFLKALDVALDDILARAWGGWHELRKYADPEQTPPDAINYVTVSDHTVKSMHEPSVDFVVNDAVFHTFNFEVSALLEAQGINLEVQAGEITEITLGNLKVGGSVNLGGHQIWEKELAQVTLRGALRLAKPIPILRPGARTDSL